MIEWTISLGAIITGVFNALMFFAAAVCFYYANKYQQQITAREVSILGGRMINVENELKELTKVVTVQAVQAKEITAMNTRITGTEAAAREWRDSLRGDLENLRARLNHD